MDSDQVRRRLHRCVSAGVFDHLSSCRGELHRLVNEWVDMAEVEYLTETQTARRGFGPTAMATIQAPVSFKVIGTVFAQALVSPDHPGVAEEQHDEQV